MLASNQVSDIFAKMLSYKRCKSHFQSYVSCYRDCRGTSVTCPRCPTFHVFKQQFDLTDTTSVDSSANECHVLLRSTDLNTTLIGSILFLPLLRGASDVESFFQQILPSIRVKSVRENAPTYVLHNVCSDELCRSFRGILAGRMEHGSTTLYGSINGCPRAVNIR